MEERTAPHTFRVQDLWLAAALVARNFKLLRVEPEQQSPAGGRQWAHFVLEDRPDRAELVRAYYAEELACPIATLRSALNLCRDALRNAAPGAGRGGA